MSDLIRREDAIEAVENNSYGMGSRASIKAIKALPSAEPEKIFCSPDAEWIPVSERLPVKGKQVLCCNKNGSVFTSAFTYLNSNGMVAFGQHYEVIAWMPLPEPYKGGAKMKGADDED